VFFKRVKIKKIKRQFTALKELLVLKNTSTKKLSDELSKREGVKTITIDPYEEVKLQTKQGEYIFQGPAIILINQD